MNSGRVDMLAPSGRTAVDCRRPLSHNFFETDVGKGMDICSADVVILFSTMLDH